MIFWYFLIPNGMENIFPTFHQTYLTIRLSKLLRNTFNMAWYFCNHDIRVCNTSFTPNDFSRSPVRKINLPKCWLSKMNKNLSPPWHIRMAMHNVKCNANICSKLNYKKNNCYHWKTNHFFLECYYKYLQKSKLRQSLWYINYQTFPQNMPLMHFCTA